MDSYPTTAAGAGPLEFPTQVAPASEAGTAATGSIDLSGGGPGAIGQQITIYATVFRLNMGGVPAPGPDEVSVDFASGPNAGVILRDAINGAGIGVTAVQPDPMAAIVDLTGPESEAGNVDITTDAPGVVVSGMSGGMSGGADAVAGRRASASHYPTV